MFKVSVVTPLYYGGKYVAHLLEMVERNVKALPAAAETCRVEYIFVNDSPEEKVALPPSSLFRTLLVEPGKNQGIHKSRALGLAHAEGDYILFLDQDDEIVDGYLVGQLPLIRKADLVVANGFRLQGRRGTAFYKNKKVQRFMLAPWVLCWVANTICSPGQVLIRKEAVPEAWRKRHLKINGADDYLLWLLLLAGKKKARIAINPKVLYRHLDTGKNLSGEREEMLRSEAEMLPCLKKHTGVLPYLINKRRISYYSWLEKKCNSGFVFSWRFMDVFLAGMLYESIVGLLLKQG